ncbi:hypothetical protein C8R45DRAFT_1071358 [Mycena sanguinolenta]|nr:hypothetical protein C8R45DRAFT_1071358 [Mycena sanguinolenta]
MSDHSLPDEIISEILSPALKVPDELFRDNSRVSPFAKNSESASAYLLVCKSWLRVATPLLYHTVILRSKAQAKALSIVLAGNKELGRFIKKLRLEGGYGPPMHIVLKCSPNISDLFLSFIIYSSDNTSGLCKGLELISPARLIINDIMYKPLKNKMASQLLEALVASILKWDRLVVFDFPYTFHSSHRFRKLIEALGQAKRLRTLLIPGASNLSWVYPQLKGCPLQAIHIKNSMAPARRKEFEKDPALSALLQFTETPLEESISELPLIPSLDPFFKPMAHTPEEVQDKVWSRVLYFAMSVPERANDSTSRGVSRRLPPLLVSKTFARLGLPHFYAHVRLKQSFAVPKFASALRSNPSIGPHVRSLNIDYWDYFDDDPVDGIDSTLLSQTTGLVRLKQRSRRDSSPYFMEEAAISWDAFETVVQCSGSTLREFSVSIGTRSKEISPTIFRDLVVLQTLEWKCGTGFLLTDIPKDGLQRLEEIHISSASQSFLTVLSLMKLESLQRVVLYELHDREAADWDPVTLLKAHGPRLTEIDLPCSKLQTLSIKLFELCPNLHFVTLSGHDSSMDDPPAVHDLDSPRAVPSLVKITFDMSELWARDKDWIAKWDGFFVKFEPERLPNLREIEVKCCVWPTNECGVPCSPYVSLIVDRRDISKSCWVRWAEMLLSRGINLTDKTGTRWRPRLKVSMMLLIYSVLNHNICLQRVAFEFEQEPEIELDFRGVDSWARCPLGLTNLERFELWFNHVPARDPEAPENSPDKRYLATKLRKLMMGPGADERKRIFLNQYDTGTLY